MVKHLTRFLLCSIPLLALGPATAQLQDAEGASEKIRPALGKPARLEPCALAGFSSLPCSRQRLVEVALATIAEARLLPYKYGGSAPEDGGFDCSGAMHYVLRKAGLEPARSSSALYLWVERDSQLHPIHEDARDLDHASFEDLKPGDLLFWSGTYEPADGRTVPITHVALYLGRELRDGRPVMVNATSGRSYRGLRAEGYGVYDFKIPAADASSRLVGYGTPPGLAD
jgi:peptidoglycan DL-endopeptidase CwlO